MAKTVKSMSVEELSEALIRGNISLNEVGIDTKNQRDAILSAVAKRNALIKKLDGEDAEKKLKFILSADKNYKLFIQLNEEQYTEDLVQIYLYGRMSEVGFNIKQDGYSLSVGKSYDGKITLTYTYVSGAEDALHYMDCELGIPLSIKSAVKVVLKIADAMKLIKEFDISVAQLGAKKMNSVLFDLLANRYKTYLAEYISKSKVGYYTLCATLCDVQANVAEKLSVVYLPFGIAVSDLVIKRLAIPEDIKNKVEDLAFHIRQRHAESEASAELASISLKSYEEKLAIQAKYPDAEYSLTEYEKDLALERYLAKVGRAGEEESVDHSIAISGKADAVDAAVVKQVDVVPEQEKRNVFKTAYILSVLGAVLVSLIVMGSSVGAGLIMLAVEAAIFGAVAAFNIERFKTPEDKPDDVIEESK